MRPSFSRKRFSGLMSRWTMPLSCAAARPSATLRRVLGGLAHADRPLAQPRAHRLALEELRHHEEPIALLAGVVDRDDVGVRERRHRLRLGLEAGERVGVIGEVLGQDLDRHVALEAGIAGAVDLPHPAGAERRDDLVRAEAVAGREAHGSAAIHTSASSDLLDVGEPAAVRRQGGALSPREAPGLARPHVHDLDLPRGVPTTRRAASSQRTSEPPGRRAGGRCPRRARARRARATPRRGRWRTRPGPARPATRSARTGYVLVDRGQSARGRLAHGLPQVDAPRLLVQSRARRELGAVGGPARERQPPGECRHPLQLAPVRADRERLVARPRGSSRRRGGGRPATRSRRGRGRRRR